MTAADGHSELKSSTAQRHFVYVQYLRAIAALLVVYFHTKIYDPQFIWRFDRSFGYGGVDIFFAVSGFIMTLNNYERRQSPGRFMISRMLRIYPPYWVATTISVVLFFLAPFAFIKDEIDLPYIVYSYALLPLNNPAATSGGVPFLKIAWTLVFEMYFYVIFACSLAFPRAIARLSLQAAFILAMIAYGAFQHPSGAPMSFFTSPMALEFLLGCVVGMLVGANACDWSRSIFVVGLVAFTFLFLIGGGHGDGALRVIHLGVPAMGCLLCTALLELHHGAEWKSSTMLLIGDASYSIYLFHPFVLTAVRLASKTLNIGTTSSAGGAIGVSVCVLACGLVGVLAHVWIEKPLLILSRRAIMPRASLVVQT